METKTYTLLRDGSGWAYRGPEELSQTYQSKGAALVGAFSAIQRAVAEGDAVDLEIPAGRGRPQPFVLRVV